VLVYLDMRKLIEGARKLGIELSARQLDRFELYYQELVQWNRRTNLTAITDYVSVQVKHFLDSLTIALALPANEMQRPDFGIVDIGTGAGFPGLPLKIVFPRPRLLLIEPTTKKAAFLQHLIVKLGLRGVDLLNGRAEETAHLPLYRERFSLALARAVAPLPTLAELTLPFCDMGGRFVAQKKGEINEEVTRAEKAIAAMGGKLGDIKRIELDEFTDARYLIIIDKIRPTPEKYPRRAGIPERRPI
jgi:16S rRNA (guanine527-N7)-methyltransferase